MIGTMHTIITKTEAKAQGRKTYFTGKPCPKGHSCERRVDNRACVECKRGTSSAWRDANPERKRTTAAAWRAANPEYHREYRAENLERASVTGAAWRAANPDRQRAAEAAWRAANSDRQRAINAAWQAANTERKRATDAAWRAANAQRLRAAAAAYRAANPEKANAITAKRRATKRGAIPADWCQTDQAKVRKMYAACKRLEALTGFPWNVDHRVPLSKGGTHCASNLQVIPARLNFRKGDKLMYVEAFAWVADAMADPALALPWMRNGGDADEQIINKPCSSVV
ncbi:hypothetical protein XccvBFoX1_gp28 [Xanthomonas phage FoX1]|uniref:HNH endonuclease n=1 Tax=Xanthomonas phage FoX1 TaxID=2723897 RepID=A0A858NWW5_9CAUD|nr:hypothetical protein KNU93_gp28 [Xanthomonas phage FoX1]QJB21767.1 hypothetical protein XccvBFoX1_gp28 [Xanthomonas phage FoX1]